MAKSEKLDPLDNSLLCSMCGKTLMLYEDVRYIVRIQVFAAPDPMEISREDLERDFETEIREIISAIEGKSAQELQDEVFREFYYYLCPACQKKYLRNPLPRLDNDDSD